MPRPRSISVWPASRMAGLAACWSKIKLWWLAVASWSRNSSRLADSHSARNDELFRPVQIESFLTVRLKRAEGPKALSPGHRPGYKCIISVWGLMQHRTKWFRYWFYQAWRIYGSFGKQSQLGFCCRDILRCVTSWCWDNTHVKCWRYLFVDTVIQWKVEQTGKLRGTFQVLDYNILMLVHP